MHSLHKTRCSSTAVRAVSEPGLNVSQKLFLSSMQACTPTLFTPNHACALPILTSWGRSVASRRVACKSGGHRGDAGFALAVNRRGSAAWQFTWIVCTTAQADQQARQPEALHEFSLHSHTVHTVHTPPLQFVSAYQLGAEHGQREGSLQGGEQRSGGRQSVDMADWLSLLHGRRR